MVEDEFDEIEEVKEEYTKAPLFQRIHTSGDETTGVSNVMMLLYYAVARLCGSCRFCSSRGSILIHRKTFNV